VSNVETTFKGAFVLATCATPLEVDSVASKHDVNDVNAPGPINRLLETFSMEGTSLSQIEPAGFVVDQPPTVENSSITRIKFDGALIVGKGAVILAFLS
jgi:hypothetical protein